MDLHYMLERKISVSLISNSCCSLPERAGIPPGNIKTKPHSKLRGIKFAAQRAAEYLKPRRQPPRSGKPGFGSLLAGIKELLYFGRKK